MNEIHHGIELDYDALRRKNVLIATPMHRGVCTGAYTASLVKLTCAMAKIGIPFAYLPCEGDALITRARNRIATQFLAGKWEQLLLLDGDIEFNSGDMLTMMAANKELIGAAYPLKRLNWEKVEKLGLASASVLEKVASSDFVVNYLDTEFGVNYLCRVAEIGTGCMLIDRAVFEHMISNIGGQIGCKPMADDPSYEGYIWSFFDCGRDEDGYYQPEDYTFCRRWRKLGGDIWLCPWITLGHVGTVKFVGSAKYAFLEGGKFNAKLVGVK